MEVKANGNRFEIRVMGGSFARPRVGVGLATELMKHFKIHLGVEKGYGTE